MTKRILSLVLLCALILMAACTPKTPAATNAPTAAKTTAPAAVATTAPAATETPEVSNFNLTGYPIVNETVTLTAFQHEIENQTQDFANLWYYQELIL